MDALVSTEWLAGALGAADLLILDASYDAGVPGDRARDYAAEHAAGHIPGARFMDLAGFSDPHAVLPSTMPDAARFAERAVRLGLGTATRIVLYDDAPHRTAARAWVMLRAFGVTGVALLDGGLAKWKAEGRPLAAGAPKPADATPFAARATGIGLHDIDAMRAIVRHGGAQIVDARSPARFSGAEPDPRAGVAPGHMPGARNLPYARLFLPDGTWKRGAELAAALADAGIDIDRPLAMTCGSGITASVLAFGAHLLGRHAAVYDGSWTEWGADPTTAKITGDA